MNILCLRGSSEESHCESDTIGFHEGLSMTNPPYCNLFVLYLVHMGILFIKLFYIMFLLIFLNKNILF